MHSHYMHIKQYENDVKSIGRHIKVRKYNEFNASLSRVQYRMFLQFPCSCLAVLPGSDMYCYIFRKKAMQQGRKRGARQASENE